MTRCSESRRGASIAHELVLDEALKNLDAAAISTSLAAPAPLRAKSLTGWGLCPSAYLPGEEQKVWRSAWPWLAQPGPPLFGLQDFYGHAA